jgi:hypothetical protein
VSTTLRSAGRHHAACRFVPSSSVRPLLGVHVDVPPDLLARLASDGTCAISARTHWGTATHCLGLRPLPRFRASRGATSADGRPDILKFSTLPNVFCAQGDGRWWQDHRTPGGVMITSNALGHFMYSRNTEVILQEKDKLWALENAMRTISNAYRDPDNKKSGRLRHCPATHLVPRVQGEASPLRDSSTFSRFSSDHYQGYFHTDYLIPAAFFQPERDPKALKHYEDPGLRYIFDPAGDPQDHAELMTGVSATWYEVRRNVDRLPDFVNPEKPSADFSEPIRARLARWLEERLKGRLEG